MTIVMSVARVPMNRTCVQVANVLSRVWLVVTLDTVTLTLKLGAHARALIALLTVNVLSFDHCNQFVSLKSGSLGTQLKK